MMLSADGGSKEPGQAWRLGEPLRFLPSRDADEDNLRDDLIPRSSPKVLEAAISGRESWL